MAESSAQGDGLVRSNEGGIRAPTHHFRQGTCGHIMSNRDPHLVKCLECCDCSASNRCQFTADWDFSIVFKKKKKRSPSVEVSKPSKSQKSQKFQKSQKSQESQKSKKIKSVIVVSNPVPCDPLFPSDTEEPLPPSDEDRTRAVSRE
jgi:hypothetical protein